MISYLRFEGSSLPSLVGVDGDRNVRLSDGRAGHVSFGPYFSADPGSYIAGFYIRRAGPPLNATFDVDVFSDGHDMFASKRFIHADLFEDVATLIFLPFALAERVDRLEVRIFVNQDVLIEIQELVVFTTNQRAWSAK